MESRELFKQMLEVNKNSFKSTFETMSMLNKQNKEMAEAFLSQASWMPEEGKKACSDWLNAINKGADDFKKVVDENYSRVESFLNDK